MVHVPSDPLILDEDLFRRILSFCSVPSLLAISEVRRIYPFSLSIPGTQQTYCLRHVVTSMPLFSLDMSG
jgi:hypothetical protein